MCFEAVVSWLLWTFRYFVETLRRSFLGRPRSAEQALDVLEAVALQCGEKALSSFKSAHFTGSRRLQSLANHPLRRSAAGLTAEPKQAKEEAT